MALIRMDIQSVVVGAGPVASMIILKPRHDKTLAKLPIRIGSFEATAISMGVEGHRHNRPMTHDLMCDLIQKLGSSVSCVVISDVRGSTFFAQVRLSNGVGEDVCIDARPSDALALAVRVHAPIFAEEDVIDRAALPDFGAVERDEREREAEAFHNFVQNVSPDDFVG